MSIDFFQNIRDRYYGVNDPVAEKILGRTSSLPAITPPEDPHITTLYIGGLDETFTEADLKDHFYQYGEVRSITMVPKQVRTVASLSLNIRLIL